MLKIRRQHTRGLGAYLFIVPALVAYIYFVFLPTLSTIRYSLYDWNGVSADMKFVGVDNYTAMIADPIFWKALVNNIYWMCGTIGIALVLGLILAVLLLQSGISEQASAVFRVVYFVPVVLSMIVIGIIWSWIYHPDYGTMNVLLRAVGLQTFARPWLGSETMVMPAIIFVGCWHISGFFMMIFIAGLQGIDPTYYEVGKIDGASSLRMFFAVTIPLLRNTLTLLVVWAVIWSFKIFDLVYQMTGGGPFHSSEVIALYMFTNAFRLYETGYASALAISLALIITVFSVIYIRAVEKNE